MHIPIELVKIIDNYNDVDKLLEKFKIFVKKYQLIGNPDQPIIKSAQYLDVYNINELDGFCYEFYYKECDKIHPSIIEMDFCGCYSENGFGVDNSDDENGDNDTAKTGYLIGENKGLYWSPNNKRFPLTNRIKFNTCKFNQWVIPSDFKLFISRYRGFVFGDFELQFPHKEFFVGPEYGYITQYLGFEVMSEFKVNEWRSFYQDFNSVNYGHSKLIMNLNPKSPYFGYVLSYSSGDKDTISLAAKSFTQLIEKLNEYKAHPKYANSLCDVLNGIFDDEYEWFRDEIESNDCD